MLLHISSMMTFQHGTRTTACRCICAHCITSHLKFRNVSRLIQMESMLIDEEIEVITTYDISQAQQLRNKMYMVKNWTAFLHFYFILFKLINNGQLIVCGLISIFRRFTPEITIFLLESLTFYRYLSTKFAVQWKSLFAFSYLRSDVSDTKWCARPIRFLYSHAEMSLEFMTFGRNRKSRALELSKWTRNG